MEQGKTEIPNKKQRSTEGEKKQREKKNLRTKRERNIWWTGREYERKENNDSKRQTIIG